MIFEHIRQYILTRPGVVEEWPILPEIPVFRVGKTMFAYGWPLSVPPKLSLRTCIVQDMAVSDSGSALLRNQRRGTGEWSTIELDGSIAEAQLRVWVDAAYARACHLQQSRDDANRGIGTS